MKTRLTILLILPVLITGCASIVDGGPKTVKVNSKPEGAKVTVANKSGKTVATITTPAKIKLARTSGFLGEEDYKLTFEMEGYYPYETHVKSGINGWYFGNIFLGGIVGCIVDMSTGSCYTLTPGDVNCNLVLANRQMTPEELAAAQEAANPKTKIKPATDPKAGQRY